MSDRWTEAQLRGELYWVLAVTWAGGTFYLSTDRLDITDGADTIEATPDLVDAPAVEEALEIWSVEAPRLSVPLSFMLPVSVPELVQAGHALDGAVGELSQWAEGTAWDERRVIVRGQLVDPEYGAEWEPVTCSLEEMVADTQTTLPLDSIVIADWLAQAVSMDPSAQAVDGGSVVPMVWGTPGGGTRPGSPTPIITATVYNVFLGVACHYVAASSVDIVDASGTTETCQVFYTDVREVFGQTRGMPIVACVALSTTSTSLNLEDPLHAIWNNGAALVDESSAAIRGVGDLLAYVFRRSALRVDWGRMDAARAMLNAYATSGFIDEPVTLGEYVTGVLAEAFPFAMAAGPAGVYPYAWPVYPSASAAIAELDTGADPEIERASRIAYEGSDEIATHIEVRYGWNPAEETYALTRRVAGEVTTVDNIRTTIRQLAAPFARYGNRRKVLETTVVHDDATAVRVGIAQAARFGQPSRRVQYSAPRRLGWLRRGDLVTLTDAEVAASGQLCLIESVAWEETGALLFTLRYIEAGA